MHVVAAPHSEALRLAERLWGVRGPHVERLVDVRSGQAGDVELVIERGERSLRELLAGGLALGEATTVLVPLAECVERLARLGIVHGAISTAEIRFEIDGAPVLGGFDLASVGGGLAEPVPSDDLDGYRQLAREVLAAVVDEPTAVAHLNEWLERPAGEAPGALLAFAERLLESAAPRPVSLGRAPMSPLPSAFENRDGLGARARSWRARVRSTCRRLARSRGPLGAVRARFWIVAAVGAVAAAISLMVLIRWPAGPDSPEPPETIESTPSTEHAGAPAASEPLTPSSDPVEVVLSLRHDVRGARIVEDFGDLVLLELDTSAGAESALVERTEQGWRLRATPVSAESD